MSTPFKMKPGRGNMPKTGRGIHPALMSCSPMKQELTEKEKQKMKEAGQKSEALGKEARKAVESYPSNKSLTKREFDVEVAAAKDSISASRRPDAYLYTKRELGAQGNKAANETRKANQSNIRVEKKEVYDKKKGAIDKYSKNK